ncbi:helix-turn-helix domain-containing protein [Pseudarthrobacter sp. NPDC092439]|uniref:helix-turn-helix domain-containing protein n=1 Tax=unclassified Pseudarthrobacter TaxID=2647000 RepID=UPI003826CB9F
MEISGSVTKTVGEPIGARVAANIARLREKRGLSQPQLTELLKERGISFARGAVSKIEKGQRKLDPDELVGFALALGTTPNALLFGEDSFLPTEELGLTQADNYPAERVWTWADGEFPIEPATTKAQLEFQKEARPHLPPVLLKDLPRQVRDAQPSKNLEDAYKAAAKYFERDRTVLDLLMGELRRELPEPFDLDKWHEGQDLLTPLGDDPDA